MLFGGQSTTIDTIAMTVTTFAGLARLQTNLIVFSARGD